MPKLIKAAGAAACATALMLLTGCEGTPKLAEAEKTMSRYRAMAPSAYMCDAGELSRFRKAVRGYSKAKSAEGDQWPDFSYKRNRPDDMTVNALAGHFVLLISASDMGQSAWHLNELQPDWGAIGIYRDTDSLNYRPSKTLLRKGAKYACPELIAYGRALAELQLSQAYWRERYVTEQIIQTRAAQSRQDMLGRASKRIRTNFRSLLRLERALVDKVDAQSS